MRRVAFDQKEKDTTYRISRAVKREEFSTLVFELGETCQRIFPRRNSNRVHRISVLEVSHGEVGQRSFGIAVDRELVPDLSNPPRVRSVRTRVRERERVSGRGGVETSPLRVVTWFHTSQNRMTCHLLLQGRTGNKEDLRRNH